MEANKSAPSLNRGLSLNLWWQKSTNYVKFPEECMMCTEKHILVKKIFTKELNMALLGQVQVKKTAHELEINSLVKKILGTAVHKGYTCFLGHKKGPTLFS